MDNENEKEIIENLIELLLANEIYESDTLLHIKSTFNSFIHTLSKHKKNSLLTIVKDIPQMIDIAIEIPNEVVRKSCIKMIAEVLQEVNTYYSLGLDEISKKKLKEKIRIEFEELQEYMKNQKLYNSDASTTHNNEIASYEELHNQYIQKSIIADRLYEKMQSLEYFVHDIIKLMMHLVEAKEPYLLGHSMKVAFLAVSLSKRIITEYDIQMIKYAALLHDIGRILIQDTALYSNKRLQDDELKQIRYHTVAGYNAVKNLSFNPIIKDAILYHHESYDGTGYPKGLRGEDIPLIARIIKIADVYDALTSERPYRLGHTKQEALAIMYHDREKFDPDLLQEFFIMM